MTRYVIDPKEVPEFKTAHENFKNSMPDYERLTALAGMGALGLVDEEASPESKDNALAIYALGVARGLQLAGAATHDNSHSVPVNTVE